MARNRYVKSHTNYVYKKFHQSTTDGNIYERDYTTISQVDGYSPGQTPLYRTGNFVLTVRNEPTFKKKHKYGSWVKNNAGDCAGSSQTQWTLDCISEDTVKKSADEIKIKPKYSSIRDFVCYGSAVDYVESSIKDIIKRYPGELVLTNNQVEVEGSVRKYYRVYNPFGLNLVDDFVDEDAYRSVRRYFSHYHIVPPQKVKSRTELMDGDGVIKKDAGEPIMKDENDTYCVDHIKHRVDIGDIHFVYAYIYDDEHVEIVYEEDELKNKDYPAKYAKAVNSKGGRLVYLWYNTFEEDYSGYSIRPDSYIVNRFFDSLNDFQKTLLNRSTDYTATLMTVEENSDGYFIEIPTEYSWPTDGWNLDIESKSDYVPYVNRLLKMAEMYDEYWTNNLYRMMTHEAIINFDNTYTRERINGNNVDTEELVKPNSTRITDYIRLCGRVFDEIKLYIDNIKYSTNITYNQENNVPDYFLTDRLENSGWDSKNILEEGSDEIKTDGGLYPGETDGYCINDANCEFFRRLLLNTRYILSTKGTKAGIEAILALFGLRSMDFLRQKKYYRSEKEVVDWNGLSNEEKKEELRNAYEMKEYVYIATSGSTILEEGNADYVRNYAGNERFTDEKTFDQLLPVREVITTNGDKETSTIVPWFDKDNEYTGDIYFEGKGAWCKQDSKVVTDTALGDGIVISDSDELYNETVKRIKFSDNVASLRNTLDQDLTEGDVFYVSDISDFKKYNTVEEEMLDITYIKTPMPRPNIVTSGETRQMSYSGANDSLITVSGVKEILQDRYYDVDESGKKKRLYFVKSELKNDRSDNNIKIKASDGYFFDKVVIKAFSDNGAARLTFDNSTLTLIGSDGTAVNENYVVVKSVPEVEDSVIKNDASEFTIQVNNPDTSRVNEINITLSSGNISFYIDIYTANIKKAFSHYFVLENKDYPDALGTEYVPIRSSNDMTYKKTYYHFDDETSSYVAYNYFKDAEDAVKNNTVVYEYIRGWRNVSEEEIAEMETDDAKRIVYLEGIKEKNTGNNPHNGKGEYDSGEFFRDFFRNVFKGPIENGEFDNVSDHLIPWINHNTGDVTKYIGFDLIKQEDNLKTYYFYDGSVDEKKAGEITAYSVVGPTEEIVDNDGEEFRKMVNYGMVEKSNYEPWPDFEVGYILDDDDDLSCDVDTGTSYEPGLRKFSEIEIYDLENKKTFVGEHGIEEGYSYSVINSKQFNIDFKTNPIEDKNGFSNYEFINDVVMSYLTQMIPSTTIFSYNSQDVSKYQSAASITPSLGYLANTTSESTE